MKEPRHDDERLAELLEGRLEGPERDELLAYLAQADEDLHVFARTAAVLREMEEEAAAQVPQTAQEEVTHPPVRDTRPPSVRGRRRWKAPRALIPAVLVGLVALTTFVTRRQAAPGLGPVALSEYVVNVSDSITEARISRPSQSRGADEGDAARAGALLLHLSIAVRAQDTVQTRDLARTIRAEFGLSPRAEDSPVMQLDTRAGAPPSELLPLVDELTDRLAETHERGYLRLGAWTEAAQLAAASQDAGFFRTDATRTTLRQAARITRDDPPAREAAAAVRATLEQRTWNFGTLTQRLQALEAALAG